MEQAELAETVRRAIQVTVASKIAAYVTLFVPSLPGRILLTFGSAALVIGVRGASPAGRRLPSGTVVADIALAVASLFLLQAVPATGAGSHLLTLAHLCIVLLSGSVLAPVALGHYGDAFLGNIQYLTARSVADTLLGLGPPVVALVIAGGCAAVAGWGAGGDCVLATTLAQAAMAVLRTLVLASLPPGLQLPSIVGILCLVRPLYRAGILGGGCGALYSFALYQSGDALQEALGALLPPLVAAIAAVTLAAASPLPVFRAVAQIAAVGAATDWLMAALREVADSDPFPSLVSLLVFARVLVAGTGG